MVTDEEIARGVESLLRQSNPNSFTSLNGVVQQLESKLGLDLSHKATFIRDQISLLLRSNPHPLPQPQLPKDHFALHSHPQYPTPLHPQQFPSHFALHPYHQRPTDPHFQASPPSLQPLPPHVLAQNQSQNQNQNQNHAHLQAQAQAQIQSQSRTHPQQPPPAKREVFAQNAAIVAPEVPKESTPVGAKRRGGPGGLSKVCSVSPELQAIVGEPALPRTEIVKQLWAYIRKNNLQDPSNKRKIICDDALRVVFETDCTDMFKMNKLLAKHIIALEPSKASNQAKKVKVDAEPANTNAETGSSSIVISEALANFLGTGEREMPQAEAIRLVWEYIKVNHLEDPSSTMVILCDPKLRELLGCESISALGISEMVARHHCIKKS